MPPIEGRAKEDSLTKTFAVNINSSVKKADLEKMMTKMTKETLSKALPGDDIEWTVKIEFTGSSQNLSQEEKNLLMDELLK